MSKKPAQRKEKRNLRYDFTQDQLRTLGKELAEGQIKLRQMEDDKKMVMDEWKAKISFQEASITSLSNKVSSGYEYRDMACTATLNEPVKGQKTVRRDDNGEIVRIEEMTDADLTLFPDDEDATGEDND